MSYYKCEKLNPTLYNLHLDLRISKNMCENEWHTNPNKTAKETEHPFKHFVNVHPYQIEAPSNIART